MKYIIVYTILFSLNTCLLAQSIYKESRNKVGDIEYIYGVDNPDFKLLDENKILPYNTQCGMLIEGEKYQVLEYFHKNTDFKFTEGLDGYVTIRFIVNYEGKTDRFRVYEMDNNYKSCYFPREITDRLLLLTKELRGWKTQVNRGLEQAKEEIKNDKKSLCDYYQYILFKIKDGLLEAILP